MTGMDFRFCKMGSLRRLFVWCDMNIQNFCQHLQAPEVAEFDPQPRSFAERFRLGGRTPAAVGADKSMWQSDSGSLNGHLKLLQAARSCQLFALAFREISAKMCKDVAGYLVIMVQRLHMDCGSLKASRS